MNQNERPTEDADREYEKLLRKNPKLAANIHGKTTRTILGITICAPLVPLMIMVATSKHSESLWGLVVITVGAMILGSVISAILVATLAPDGWSGFRYGLASFLGLAAFYTACLFFGCSANLSR